MNLQVSVDHFVALHHPDPYITFHRLRLFQNVPRQASLVLWSKSSTPFTFKGVKLEAPTESHEKAVDVAVFEGKTPVERTKGATFFLVANTRAALLTMIKDVSSKLAPEAIHGFLSAPLDPDSANIIGAAITSLDHGQGEDLYTKVMQVVKKFYEQAYQKRLERSRILAEDQAKVTQVVSRKRPGDNFTEDEAKLLTDLAAKRRSEESPTVLSKEEKKLLSAAKERLKQANPNLTTTPGGTTENPKTPRKAGTAAKAGKDSYFNVNDLFNKPE